MPEVFLEVFPGRLGRWIILFRVTIFALMAIGRRLVVLRYGIHRR